MIGIGIGVKQQKVGGYGLAKPVATAATGVGQTSFTANWNAYTGAVVYLLDVSTSPTFDTFIYENQEVNAPSTSYVVIGLEPNTTYYYRVRASTEALTDPDYQEFYDRVIAAGGSLTSTEQAATEQLVLDLKDYGIWTKMKAIYPMVGASAAACAQNLKSSSFTGTFNGGWTFASTGVTGNGTSAYMDTNFNPSLHYDNFNNGYSIYCTTNSSIARWDFGAYPGFHVYLNYPTVGCKAAVQTTDGNRLQFNDNDSRGLFTFTNGGNNLRKAFRNGVLKNTNTNVDNTTMINKSLPLGCLWENNVYYLFSNRQYAMLALHQSLTDTQASNFYTAVQAFQTTLSRNV